MMKSIFALIVTLQIVPSVAYAGKLDPAKVREYNEKCLKFLSDPERQVANPAHACSCVGKKLADDASFNSDEVANDKLAYLIKTLGPDSFDDTTERNDLNDQIHTWESDCQKSPKAKAH